MCLRGLLTALLTVSCDWVGNPVILVPWRAPHAKVRTASGRGRELGNSYMGSLPSDKSLAFVHQSMTGGWRRGPQRIRIPEGLNTSSSQKVESRDER